MKTAIALVIIPLAMLFSACASDDGPTEPMNFRCEQVEGALDNLATDLGTHAHAILRETEHLDDVMAAEQGHRAGMLRHLGVANSWLMAMRTCTDDEGADAPTDLVFAASWEAYVTLDRHHNAMLAVTTMAEAMAEEDTYQLNMLALLGDMRVRIAELDAMAADFACVPLPPTE